MKVVRAGGPGARILEAVERFVQQLWGHLNGYPAVGPYHRRLGYHSVGHAGGLQRLFGLQRPMGRIEYEQLRPALLCHVLT
jgi:hypothetical protein